MVSAEKWFQTVQWYRSFPRVPSRLRAELGPRKKPVPGFIYFFESVTKGWFKAGRTADWKARKRHYTGPSEIKKIFFVRAVSDMWKAEEQLLAFLDAHGYHRKHKKTEWFTREQGDRLSLVLAKP